ncbi:hypothetical protein MTHERMMSTA1_11890 [Methanosarcina thermophila MST-A1]|uniref:Uncharacterized protein n=1 Tax=Methanosarcina thermophila TaxID=2210 RepID=A0A3G9CTW3_METTE|nr:hypothetical protein MESMT1_1633 [Methanosarcina thermophila]GLI14063.1 hypothetical protein MTHERMMSTA1_11890 [Methanosarcina thermophila MST-A1]
MEEQNTQGKLKKNSLTGGVTKERNIQEEEVDEKQTVVREDWLEIKAGS